MGWGSGGSGVGTGVGSPEAAQGRRALHPDPPPGPVDPSDRPSCLRAILTLVVLVVAAIAVLWLAGELLGPA
jgi:hypothetical protein